MHSIPPSEDITARIIRGPTVSWEEMASMVRRGKGAGTVYTRDAIGNHYSFVAMPMWMVRLLMELV